MTNVAGSITSVVATLTVNTVSTNTPDFSMIGFATLDGFSSNSTLRVGGTTGGAGGALVYATNLASLKSYAESATTYRILITTNIDMSSLNNNDNSLSSFPTGLINVGNNKTIYSTNGATIRLGSFHIKSKSNVIIRNLKFTDMWFDNSVADPGYDLHDWDYIRLDGAHHVWIDHCEFHQVYDGMVDMKNGADYATVSWCIFRLQKKCSLIGSSDSTTSDRSHLNVTYHHNWYEDVDERTPRMRFGNAHVFNMYYANAHLSGKCIQSTMEAATLVENVFFTNAPNSYPTVYVNGGGNGNALKVVNSTIVNSSGNRGFQQLNASTFMFNSPWVTNAPPYGYTNLLDPTANVPNVVTNWAGCGKVSL